LEIAIPIPDELLGKTGYVIYRVHDGEVNTITENANSDGEYIEVTDDGYIILYVRKFSTYAIGYSNDAVAASRASETVYWLWWIIPAAAAFVFLLVIFLIKKRSRNSDKANDNMDSYI
jgi:hypothetical protein